MATRKGAGQEQVEPRKRRTRQRRGVGDDDGAYTIEWPPAKGRTALGTARPDERERGSSE